MANQKISELSTASTLTGTELVEVVQSGSNKKTTAQAIADLATGGGDGDTDITGKLDAIGTKVVGGTNYTLQASDLTLIENGANVIIEGDGTGTLTIPLNATVAFPQTCFIGFRGFILVAATGGVTLTPTNVTLDCDPEFTFYLEKTATDSWIVNNGAEDTGGGSVSDWGDIEGTLSDQTDLQAALDAKQATLVSATNIKTVNSSSILGSGNLTVAGEALTSAPVTTTGSTITLDLDSLTQKMFVGSTTFGTSKTMALSNATNAKVFNFHFQITTVAASLSLPGTWLMSDANFAANIWTPTQIGKYEMGGSYDGTNWKIKIMGPFS